MSRKSKLAILAVLVALSLVLGGCRRSATPPLDDIQTEAEAMVQEAEENPTPVVVQPVDEEPAPPVEEAEAPPAEEAEAPAAEEAEAPAETTVVLPVVVTGAEAEAAPPAPAAPEAVSTPGTHVVQPGENLFRIAMRYGTTVEAIARANGITNAALIYVGQRLTIPSGTPPAAPAPPPSTGGRVHVVQPGENLFRIALRYNVNQYHLAQYNGISNPSLIYVGQVIRIP